MGIADILGTRVDARRGARAILPGNCVSSLDDVGNFQRRRRPDVLRPLLLASALLMHG